MTSCDLQNRFLQSCPVHLGRSSNFTHLARIADAKQSNPNTPQLLGQSPTMPSKDSKEQHSEEEAQGLLLAPQEDTPAEAPTIPALPPVVEAAKEQEQGICRICKSRGSPSDSQVCSFRALPASPAAGASALSKRMNAFPPERIMHWSCGCH